MPQLPRTAVRLATLVAAAALLPLAGCGGRPVAPAGATPPRAAAPAATPSKPPITTWNGLAMLPPPPVPKVKPLKLPAGRATLFRQVPTEDKVVFITIDDGWTKDPKFAQMVKDLNIPISVFLTNDAIKDDYGYFKRFQETGVALQNHTMTHPNLKKLSAAAQRREICGPQSIYQRQYGAAPKLFRPPFGNYNATTLKVAGECGLRGVVLWGATLPGSDLYGPVKPGQIILTHFRKKLVPHFIDMVKGIQAKGYRVARLEDYLEIQ